MLIEILVRALAVRIKQTFYHLTLGHIASRQVGELVCQSRIVGAAEISQALNTVGEDSHPLLGDDGFENLLPVNAAESADV